MKKTMGLSVFWLFALGQMAFASGGMIGGGDVVYRSRLECDGVAFDPTHSEVSKVWVVQESDADGNYIPDTTLRLVTLDAALNPIRFFVTHDLELFESPDGALDLTLWNYDLGSDGLERLGSFSWDERSQQGAITPVSSGDEIEAVTLSGCVRTDQEKS